MQSFQRLCNRWIGIGYLTWVFYCHWVLLGTVLHGVTPLTGLTNTGCFMGSRPVSASPTHSPLCHIVSPDSCFITLGSANTTNYNNEKRTPHRCTTEHCQAWLSMAASLRWLLGQIARDVGDNRSFRCRGDPSRPLPLCFSVLIWDLWESRTTSVDNTLTEFGQNRFCLIQTWLKTVDLIGASHLIQTTLPCGSHFVRISLIRIRAHSKSLSNSSVISAMIICLLCLKFS